MYYLLQNFIMSYIIRSIIIINSDLGWWHLKYLNFPSIPNLIGELKLMIIILWCRLSKIQVISIMINIVHKDLLKHLNLFYSKHINL